ncbi:hypothetical protein CEXT_762571 [Caerostris extrusa]|uniref:Uncharacterized protein n=1 Tax=Caerostris extrusa TaxID=172846 RepID=A0AAV4S7E4_CAEEX|nr:hypothetical protein CEXT_762571 [Caerostris extrusa]
MCTLCMKPVDYGDSTDMSEEKDSSEEDEAERIETDKKDYKYQYGKREATSEGEDQGSKTPGKKRQLATVHDLSDDDV